MTEPYHQVISTQSAVETELLAKRVALWATANCLISLRGDLGAGKSTFARALIRALAPPNLEFDIPSPSFSLVQTYSETRIKICHVDLYRVKSTDEVIELALDELAKDHLLIVEWPEKLPELSLSSVLKLSFSGQGEARLIDVQASGLWAKAFTRDHEIEKFIAASSWSNAQRVFLEGDASSRRYELLVEARQSALLMDMPRRPDGPPVKDGKPYSVIAHLAEDISAVLAVNSHLSSLGYSAPIVEAHDLASGLAIIENLGNLVFGRMLLAGEDISLPMQTAVALLADMAEQHWPNKIEISPLRSHKIEHYDLEAQLAEVNLVVSWFWPHLRGSGCDPKAAQKFVQIWRDLLPLTVPAKPQWVMRDFHSPNLIWLPDREGIKRVGLIDTQDAVLGHPAYDLVSLLQDARVDIDPSLTQQLYQQYVELRSSNSNFDAANFASVFAILGAQRATKILGIFARLNKRDGKSVYLKHIPRVAKYLVQNLKHPNLAHLSLWYETYLPEVFNMSSNH